MAFDFFYSALSQRRSYDYSALDREFIERETSRMRLAYPNAEFVLPSDGPFGNWGCPSTTVSHLAAPPSDGITEIEREFDINLPADFNAFYRLHNEAFILGRNPVLIMSPAQIIYVSDDLRDAHDIPDDLPRHVIRFGWLGTDSYFLLRFNASNNDWEVMLSSYSHATDAELQDRTAWGTPCDKTFTDWLRRMMETDGAPLHPAHEGDFDFSNKRVA
jgi:hypothetical protein